MLRGNRKMKKGEKAESKKQKAIVAEVNGYQLMPISALQ